MSSHFSSIVVHSQEIDNELLGNDLIKQSRIKLQSLKPQAGLLFLGIDFDHQLIADRLMNEWPNLELSGCTTDGEFSSILGYKEDSAVLMLLSSPNCSFVSGYIDNTSKDLKEACRASLLESFEKLEGDPKLCVLFSDVINSNGEEVMHNISEITNHTLPIVGGISADQWQFNQSFQIAKNKVSSKISTFLLISGDFHMSWGLDSGWEPFGKKGIVTKSENNVVYTIDDKPALAFYKDILGENAKPTLDLPVSIHDEKGEYRFLRTSIENYNEADGSVTYLGNVPEKSHVQITMVNREFILSGVSSALNKALKQYPSNEVPALVLCFSCAARRALLGTRTSEEYDVIKKGVGDAIPVIGFYTYGEICPNLDSCVSDFHNETFVVVLIG